MKGDKSWAETGWFSSPGLIDLDGDGKKEIAAPFYSLFVFDSAGKVDRHPKRHFPSPEENADNKD